MPDAPLIPCYDGSPDATQGIERASDLLAPRPAFVLTVWEPAPVLGPGLDGAAVIVNDLELDRAAAEAAGRTAEEGVRVAHDAGLEAEAVAVKAAGPAVAPPGSASTTCVKPLRSSHRTTSSCPASTTPGPRQRLFAEPPA